MSGEYFCIEEVVNPTSFYDGYEAQSNRSAPIDRRNCYNPRDRDDAHSTTSRKSQDFRLYEIEEQLEIAENRCNTLRGQLDSMKKFYSKAGKPDKISRVPETVPNLITEPLTHPLLTKKSRKRHASSSRIQKDGDKVQKSRPGTPTFRKKKGFAEHYHESTDTIPQKSSSSSTAIPPNAIDAPPAVRPKDHFMTHLIRQNSYSITTDNTGAAVRTINNILTGITDSVNRLSKLHSNERDSKKLKKKHKDLTVSGKASLQSDSFVHSQKNAEENQKSSNESTENNNDSSTREDLVENQKNTVVNDKSNIKIRSVWSRHTSSKLSTTKTKPKVQASSASVNLKKPIKSIARAVENTMKIHSVKTGMMEDESHSGMISRKRKRGFVKRLKPSSKVTLAKKESGLTVKSFREYATDNNLVEIYHNVAAKTSDYSDDSNHNINSKESVNKMEDFKQKGGGDLPLISVQAVPTFQVRAEVPLPNRVAPNRFFSTSRALTPINENSYTDQGQMVCHHDGGQECCCKNYAVPTIASKMKQVTKCYLQSFNFRSIPFCAARSTSPSHNIGINIQQVMSIIKTRQPISGISPTLAHNISLAAGRLQNRPLSTLVSTMSSRVCSRHAHSQCPVFGGNLNYTHLPEILQEIPEKPFNEQSGFDGDQNQRGSIETDMFTNGPSGDREELNASSVWTANSASRQHSVCTTEKVGPFQKILNKFQTSTESFHSGITRAGYFYHPYCRDISKDIFLISKENEQRMKASMQSIQSSHRSQRMPICYAAKKQRAINWNNGVMDHMNMKKKNFNANMNNSNNDVDTLSKTSDVSNNNNNNNNSLQGRERNLKTVLKNLHDEFDSLNTKYEKLAKLVDKDNAEAPPETLRELEQMEKALNKKEEEINMVMSLYTEVLALKDQVKKLRERTLSQASIALPQKSQSKTTDYKEPKAVLHLTQLLRQIQNYQMHCKNKV